jgi:putative ABC transport system permease protein
VRGALVVAQVALACALLVGSGLALRAFARVASTPPGFDPTNVATAHVALPTQKYADGDRISAFYRDVLAKMASQPGVTSVGVNSSLPMGGNNWNSSFRIEGQPPAPPGDQPILERNLVTPGYFKTLGIPLLRGRNLQETDGKGGRLVMVVNEATAERFFPGEDAIGRRITMDDDDDGKPIWIEIVGIVGDVRRDGLGQPVQDESYTPMVQNPYADAFLVARTESPDALLRALPGIVAAVDPQQAISDRQTMVERVADNMDGKRKVSLVLVSFAGAALVLACIGVFGLVSYSTRQRQREIGIRMALGSTPAAALGLAMQSGLRLVAIGLGLGIVTAIFVGRLLATRMDGVTAFDVPAYASIVAILGLAGAIACLLPALRAIRIPPASALRYE